MHAAILGVFASVFHGALVLGGMIGLTRGLVRDLLFINRLPLSPSKIHSWRNKGQTRRDHQRCSWNDFPTVQGRARQCSPEKCYACLQTKATIYRHAGSPSFAHANVNETGSQTPFPGASVIWAKPGAGPKIRSMSVRPLCPCPSATAPTAA